MFKALVKGTPDEAAVEARDNDRLGTHRVRRRSFEQGVVVDNLTRTTSSFARDGSLMRSVADWLIYRSLKRR